MGSKPITPEFGYYFAGIADGEGHFGIIRQTKRGSGKTNYSCNFVIVMRDDDRTFLEWLCETTELGAIYSQGARQKVGHASKPQAIWRVHSKRECLALAGIFAEFPLHSRKARDLAIWTSAVRYLNGDRPHGLKPVARWFKLIREVREYGSVLEPEDDDLDILSLFGDAKWV